MVECPICDYSADTDNSVIAHMSSSKGEHEGIGFQKARQKLDVEATVNGTNDSNSDSVEQSANVADSRKQSPDTGETQSDAGPDREGGKSSVSDTDAGLGLSGANPFQSTNTDNSPDTDDPDSVDDTAEASTEVSGLAILGTIGALGLALASKVAGDSSDDQTQHEVV